MTKILALVDGSAYAQSVCDFAAWAATRTAAEVELLHVLGRRKTASTPADLSGSLDADERDELLKELASIDEQKAKLALRRSRVLLDDARARLQTSQVEKVSTKLRHGDLVDAVVEFEADADLVVMGKRGEAADFTKGHLGSNLERVGRSSRKPLFVAARAYQPIQRFLIAYDGGPSAEKAIDYIVRSPLLRGVGCELLTVGSEGEMRSRLDAAAARLREAGFAVQAMLAPGHADDVIGSRVELGGIDLLVMGAYGHSRIRSLIVGSTTATMVRRCRIPVLMFR
jgi:nucleotide-binding universal stress UspA family protein